MLCAADGALRVDLRGIVAGIGDADRHRGADQNGGIDLKHKIIIVINVQALQNIADAVAADDSNSTVRLAVKVYCKANFGMDNPDADRLTQSFDDLLTMMRGSSEFGGVK